MYENGMENVSRESLQLILLNFISSMLLYNKFYIEWQKFTETQIVNIKYIGNVLPFGLFVGEVLTNQILLL